MATQITVNDVKFLVASDGWRHAEAERDAAIDRFQTILAGFRAMEFTPELLERVAARAVALETQGWRCWQRGYVGDFPALHVSKVEG